MDEASRKTEEATRQTALMSRLLLSAKPVKTAFTRGGSASASGNDKKRNTNEGKGEAQAAGAERKLGNNNYVNYNYGYYNYEDNWQNQYNEEEEEQEEEREYDDETYEEYGGLNLTNYALKYIGCQNIHTFSDEMAEDEDAEGSLIMNRFVVFRLCPKQSCSNYNQWGCDYNYGEYTMPMEDYLQTMETYHIQQYQTYCKTCALCMTGRAYQMYDEEWEQQNGQQGGRDLEQNNYNNNNYNNNANYNNGNNYNNNNNANNNNGGGGGQYYYYNKNSGYYNHNYGNQNNGYSGYNNGNNNRNNSYNNVNNGNYQNYNQNNYKNQNGVYNDDYYYQNDDGGNNGYYADPYNNYNAVENDDMYQGSNATDDDGGSPYCMYADVCEEYKAACRDDSLGDNKYMSYTENFNQYFQCSEFEFGDAVSYLAPHCRSDGFTIGIGIYEDQYCSSYVGDMVDLEEVTGQSFDDNYLSPYYPKQCISCSGSVRFIFHSLHTVCLAGYSFCVYLLGD